MTNLSKIKREKMLNYIDNLLENCDNEMDRIALNDIATALNEKKYGLVWEEHEENVDVMLEENIPILIEEENRKIKKVEENSYNFLIEGDNLHSLKMLEKTHKEKIDVIYIDPPYNTENKDFKYNDEYVDKEDGYKHSKWLSFMRCRLEIAKRLLSPKGYIFISIDDNEYAPLKLLCDEIFGEACFVNNIVVKMSESTGVKMSHAEKRLPKLKEYVLFYKANPTYPVSILEPRIPKSKWDKEYKILVKGVEKNELDTIKEIMELDSPSKEDIKRGDEICAKMFFGSVNELYEKGMKKNEKDKCLLENSYRILRDVATSASAKNISDDKKTKIKDAGAFLITTPKKKVYLMRSDYNESTKSPRCKMLFADKYLEVNAGDFWSDIKTTGLGNEGTVEFLKGKKPLALIERILKISNKKNATVLDFFAGSGTTGQAVVELNKKDGGNRKYILCTNNENNICQDITYERICGIQEEVSHNLKYFKTGFIPKEEEQSGYSIDEVLEDYVKPLIELQYHCDIDDKNIMLAFEYDEVDAKIDNANENAKLFKPSTLFLSVDAEKKVKEKNIEVIDIPKYYYSEEILKIERGL